MKLNGHGNLTYDGKEYSNTDITGIVSLGSLGYKNDFYGGNCTQFASTKEGVYLCLDASMKPFDILIPDTVPDTVPDITLDVEKSGTKPFYAEENGMFVCGGCGKSYNKKIAATGHIRFCDSFKK